MPLWVKPAQPLTRPWMFDVMKNNYAGTFFDFHNSEVDVGAGLFNASYRPRGLTWQYQGATYANERPVATQQTFTNMVVAIRPGYPSPALGTVVWFGLDGTYHTVRIPLYTGITAIPRQYAVGVADATVFSFESAFWVLNMVANAAYNNMAQIDPVVQAEIAARHAAYADALTATDAAVCSRYEAGDVAGALAQATAFSQGIGEQLIPDWLRLWQKLFITFFDLAIHVPQPGSWQPVVNPQQVTPNTYHRIVTDTGDRYLLTPAGSPHGAREKKLTSRVG